jgi:hypothetical protein
MFDNYSSGGQASIVAPSGSQPITTSNAWQNVALEGIRAIESVFISQKTASYPSSTTATQTIAQPVSENSWIPWVVGAGLIVLAIAVAKG